MSFFNSKPWAKIPTDLLENKLMLQAEKHLPKELNYAPVLFYLAGATKADDDGIFDIDDGTEFADLVKVNCPENIQKIASVMVQARIFAHVPNSSFYIFTEWEYATRQTSRSLSFRFQLAQKKAAQKAEEQSYFSVQSTKVDKVINANNYTKNENLNTIQESFDKCLNTIQGEKTAADRIEEIREIREDEIRQEQNIQDEKKTTHTRIECEEGEAKQSSGFLENPPDCFAKKDEQKSEETKENEKLLEVRKDWCIVPESENSETLQSESEKETQEAIFKPTKTVKELEDFFKANNVAYNELKGSRLVETIANDIAKHCQNDDEAVIWAKRLCKEFKAMHDAPDTDRWHNIPLMPAYMIKEAVWAQINTRVVRIYGTIKNPKALDVHEQAQKDYQEHLKDLENPTESPDAEYIRLGINPNDPDRIQKMLIKKAAQETEVLF